MNQSHSGPSGADVAAFEQRIAQLEAQLLRERQTSSKRAKSLSDRLARRGEELAAARNKLAEIEGTLSMTIEQNARV